VYLLQAQPVDLSWLPQMGEIALAIVGIIAIAVIFIKRGLPKILEYKKEVELTKMSIEKENHFSGDLQIKHDNQLKIIEKLIVDDTERQNKWQDFASKKFNEIDSKLVSMFSILTDHEELLGPLSQKTLENMLFNDALPIFRRLKAYLRLMAMGINGRVKQKGFDLILQNKKTVRDDNGVEIKIDPWLDVLETMPKMNLKIVNQQHFDAVLNEINHKFYDGMMY